MIEKEFANYKAKFAFYKIIKVKKIIEDECTLISKNTLVELANQFLISS